jgi:uncharacterized protein YndB with AHSA1/START domain
MATTTSTYTTKFTRPLDRQIIGTRTFDAPRTLVWDCWTKPEHVKNWMLGPDGWTMPVCEIDLRPGGKWHWVWRKSDGSEMEMHGEYREIVPPERLVNTENWGGDWPETLNTLVLTEENGQTTTVSTVIYPSKEARDRATATGMEDGWARSYDRFDEYLRSLA